MAISLHPSIDGGIKQGKAGFSGGTLTCLCATAPVTVSVKANVAHNHACSCRQCWKPAGAKLSVVGVVGRDNVTVTANADKLKVVNEAATSRRHACTGCGVHMYGRIEIDPLVTHKLPLVRINEAFELMHAGTSIRAVVEF